MKVPGKGVVCTEPENIQFGTCRYVFIVVQGRGQAILADWPLDRAERGEFVSLSQPERKRP